jgi:glyoxylase-like metal-dependent hydrolase (beta-lactamase superfamily II)
MSKRTGIFISILLGATTLTGCGEPLTGQDEVAKKAVSGQVINTLVQPDELRLYVFNCGQFRMNSVAAFGLSDEETDVRELVVPCYVIEHPKGTLLWDGGLPSATAATPGWSPEIQGSSVRLDKTLAQQLSSMKFDLNSFDYVAFSHIHFDHVGVANEVKNATWLVQEADYDAAFLPEGEPPGPGVQTDLLREIKNSKLIKLNGDHDVFGDGRVRLISAPGHTQGHQVLFVDLAEYGPLVLSGDLYHFRFNRAQRRVPLFNVNADQTLASMDRVESLVTEEGAQFWIEHDLALFKTLKTAPDFYR